MVMITKLEKIMREKSISSGTLSEMTGLTKMTISNARRGKNITIMNARAIANALKESVDTIWPAEPEEDEEDEAA